MCSVVVLPSPQAVKQLMPIAMQHWLNGGATSQDVAPLFNQSWTSIVFFLGGSCISHVTRSTRHIYVDGCFFCLLREPIYENPSGPKHMLALD